MSRKRVNGAASSWRRWTIQSLFYLGMILLAGQAFNLQILQYEKLESEAKARHAKVVAIPAHRGAIVDRNGEPLAISTPVDSIYLNPRLLAPMMTPEIASGLSSITGIDPAVITAKVEKNPRRGFVYLKRHMSPEVGQAIDTLKLPGVETEREYRRFYPKGEVFGHLLGFTDIDDKGQEGLELAYNDWLIGANGSKRVIKDADGHVIDELEMIKPAKEGKLLQLSVDSRIQYLAYRELKAAVEANQAESGSVVVLDPNTGEILAMANQPSFNPNDRSQLHGNLYRNRAITDVFEPGSTVKPFTVATALESGKFDTRSLVDTSPGYVRVSGFPIRDNHDLGEIDLATIIAKSSNVGASKVALALAPEELWDVFQRVGFGRPTGSGFPGEATGVLRDYSQWYELDRATLAFGYGFSVTALQLAEAFGVIAADGVAHPVTLLKSDEKPAGEQVLDPQIARTVRRMMTKVVSPDGTGYRAAIEGYSVAGKTGTARKIVGGEYSQDQYTALFAGMVPADNPRLVAIVVIHAPKSGKYYGGQVAAPVFSRISAGAMRFLNVPPDQLKTRADSKALGGKA